MSESLDKQIGILRTSFWSARDPEGRAFAPLADAYRRKGELDEAHLLVQDGLGRHPNFATGHLVAARIERDRGDLVSAREHLDRVLDLDDKNILALIGRADSAASEGDREGALEDLRLALRLDPGHLEAKTQLEFLEQGLSWEPETATVEETELPDSGGSIFTRTMGDIYARQGFREKAVEVYEHLSQEDPENAELAARLAELRGPPEEAPALTEASDQAEEPRPQEVVEPGDFQTISEYFEDLLAWVPGAVPIESLAPGAERSEQEVSEMTAQLPGEVVEDALDGAVNAQDASQEEEGLDDFNLWLKSLES